VNRTLNVVRKDIYLIELHYESYLEGGSRLHVTKLPVEELLGVGRGEGEVRDAGSEGRRPNGWSDAPAGHAGESNAHVYKLDGEEPSRLLRIAHVLSDDDRRLQRAGRHRGANRDLKRAHSGVGKHDAGHFPEEVAELGLGFGVLVFRRQLLALQTDSHPPGSSMDKGHFHLTLRVE
jgi:hypothetical protein